MSYLLFFLLIHFHLSCLSFKYIFYYFKVLSSLDIQIRELQNNSLFQFFILAWLQWFNCLKTKETTLDSLISVGLCLLISRIFSRVYDLIREVFSIAIGNKFEIFNLSSKLSVIQHYFCFFCKISRVYAYFSGQIFQRLCLFKGLCLLESLE